MEMRMKLPEQQLLTHIITHDGSSTFFSGQYQETYHSVSGAEEEAIKKYAEPCFAHLNKPHVRILDVCFGLGYNTAAALEVVFRQSAVQRSAEIVGLENDERILEKTGAVSSRFKHYPLIQSLAKTKTFGNTKEKKEKNIHLKLIIGDARETVTLLPPDYFDVVFFDPFSPKKCPELWTEAFFRDVSRVMRTGGILATYSCARSVRDAMKKAGFAVRDGPSVGRRAPGTVGIKVA